MKKFIPIIFALCLVVGCNKEQGDYPIEQTVWKFTYDSNTYTLNFRRNNMMRYDTVWGSRGDEEYTLKGNTVIFDYKMLQISELITPDDSKYYILDHGTINDNEMTLYTINGKEWITEYSKTGESYCRRIDIPNITVVATKQ